MATTLTIKGLLVDQGSGAGAAALKVEAWGQYRKPGPPGKKPGSRTRAKKLGEANTDSQGKFSITIKAGVTGLKGEVYFKVFDVAGSLLRDTKDSLTWDPDAPSQVIITVEVSEFPPPPGQAVVLGTVHHETGVAISKLIVRVCQKRIGGEQELAADSANTEGEFSILYSILEEAADIFVRVYPESNSPNPDTPLAVSDVRFNAAQEERFELIIDAPEYRGPSEFGRVEEVLTPYLQNIELEDLDAEDIALLAGKTQQSHEYVGRYVAAGIMASQADDLSQESLYALLRSGYAPPLDQLIAHASSSLESALRQAAETNIVSLQTGDQASDTVMKMQTLRRQRMVDVTHSSLGELLVLAGLDEAGRGTVADLLIEHKRGEDLWEKLRDTGFDDETVDAVRLSVELGQVTAAHTPLVKAVLQQANAPSHLTDIAWYTEDYWMALFDQDINGQPVGVPDFIAGKTAAVKRANYVQYLFTILEAAVPTAAIGAAMQRSATRPAIRSFLQDYPGFDFASSHVQTFLENNSVPTQDDLIPELKGLQRVYRIAPAHNRYQVMDVLLIQGYNSAHEIARGSQSAFIKRMQDILEKQQAISVYRKARLYTSLALTAYMSDVQGSLEPTIRMLPPWQAPWEAQPGGGNVHVSTAAANEDDAARIADYRSLFGSIDFCACEHCRSVLSPAAYFVDLLHWLGQREENVDGDTPLDVLLDRRPDLNALALSCENTNTLVAYVDLVNEILENAVARLNGDTVLPHDYSLPHSDELLATPQYFNPAAYNSLALAAYPASLPFNYWLTQARVFLKQLGVERWQLMQAYARTDDPTELEIATELLEMSTQERELVLNATPDPHLWGYSSNGDWVAELAAVATFLKRAGFTEEAGERFERLLDVLNTETANPGGQIVLLPEPEMGGPVGGGPGTTPPIGGGPGTTPPGGTPPSGYPVTQPPQPDICDLNQLVLKKTNGDPQDTDYHQMQRFLRLWRRLDWTMLELDKVLIALDKTDNIDEAVIESIADIHYIQKQTNMDLLPLLTWWAEIDTKTDRNTKTATQQVRSFFEEVFLNPALGRAVTDKFRSVIIGPLTPPPIPTPGPGPGGPGTTPPITTPGVPGGGGPGTQPPVPVPPFPGPLYLVDLEAELQAALGITAEELNQIKAAMFVDANGDDIWSDAKLNLANLSALYRVVTLARALKLEVNEALDLRAMTITAAEPLDPFSNTAQARKFIDEVREIQEAGFSVTDLLYLLGHETEAVLQLAPGLQQMALSLSKLRTGLREIRSELALQPDASGELTRALLLEAGVPEYDETNIPQDVLDEFMRLITGRSNLSDADKEDLISFVNNSVYSPDQFIDVSDAVQKLVLNTIPLDEVDKRIEYIQTAVNSYLENYRSERFVSQTLATEYNLEVRIATDLLMQRLAAMPVFLSDDFINGIPASGNSSVGEDAGVDPDLNPVDQTAAFTLLMKLHKIATLLIKQKVDVDACTWLFEHGIGWGLLDPLNLPLQSSVPALLYRPWKKLADFFRLYDTLPGVRPTIAELLKLFLRYEERWTTALDAMAGLSLGVNPADFPDLLVEAMTASIAELEQNYPQAQQADLPIVKDHAQETQNLQNAFLQGLYDRTGWEQTDFNYLSTVFDYDTPQRFHDPNTWYELIERFDIILHIAHPAQEIDPWRAADMGQVQADEIRMAVKSRYGYEQWLNVARQLQDQLREQQRTALVTYLVASESGIENSRDLYGRYLIDVEMSPCAKTSRIKQAISSVQLFVQRCFLGLEEGDGGTKLDADASREWKWRAHYRIWEANRKVFLYPENWIYPELRRDKSPFFEELESELLQNEITEETVESAYLNYLEKLNDVARLEVRALYHQKEDDEEGKTDILHVFGRTPALPHTYYYRQLIDDSRWTAWEKVELDIEGEHLMPVVHNRRLMLFWPTFLEERENIEYGDHWFNVQLAWSERKENKWSSKHVSQDSLSSGQSPFDLPLFRCTYEFTSVIVDQKLQIDFLSPMEGVRLGSFLYRDCNENVRLSTDTQPIAPRWDSDVHGITYNFLKLRSGALQLTATSPWSQTTRLIDVLDRGAKNTRVIYPRQYDGIDYSNAQGWRFGSQEPFFMEDPYRTFYIIPRIVPTMLEWNQGWHAYEIELGVLQKYVTTAGVNQMPQFSGTPFNADTSIGSGVVASTSVRGVHDYLDIGEMVVVEDSQLLPVSGGGARQFGVLPLYTEPRFRLRQTQAYLQAAVSDRVLSYFVSFNANYRFVVFYYPFICRFITQVRRYGIDGLLAPKEDGVEADLSRQQLENSEFFNEDDPVAEFSDYDPTNNVLEPYPFEDINFDSDGTYSIYNWELFFHAPFLIATRLSQDQRFEAAMRWFHYIFEPMSRSVPDNLAGNLYTRYWKVKPFTREPEPPIQQLMQNSEARQQLVSQIKAWEDQPFDPHLIAQLRPAAYQKAVVIKYLDNLIAWGDQLFRQDSIEAINEATQLYILAAEVLGPRPEKIPPLAKPSVSHFEGLRNASQGEGLDAFSDILVEVENILAPGLGEATGDEAAPLPDLGPALYFCIPQNSQLVEYWNTIEDRLFKIRHCMNIEGITRELPLFQPPIDPGLLVRAAAAGVDLSSVLSDLNAPLPHYRFNVMLEKAKALNATVRSLGNALLSALEKRDAEALALLRSSHEQNLLKAVNEVRKRQIEEAEESLEGLRRSQDVVHTRQAYYQRLVNNGLNADEKEHLSKLETALTYQWIVQAIEALGALAAAIPQISYKPPGPPEVEGGGLQFSNVMAATARGLSIGTIVNNHYANRASIRGSHRRRSDDWDHQLEVASKELENMDKQILAGEIRLAIAEKEKDNHELQIENAEVIETWMRDKFTNRQLYDWMVTQLSTLYFQSYQLVYDIAKRAEKSYQHELARPSDTFIQYGHWDSLKKGLLAGDRLQYDLERLEVAYLENDKREYELTKHLSLVMFNPLALVKLRQEGACEFELPEALFDLDQPGHYMRRIKSVSLSIPSVTGPYTGVDGMLTLQSTHIRRVPSLNNDLELEAGIAESVAISAGQNDSGLFELSHNDPRYLPFERRGAVSHWRLSLSSALAEFDRQTISDVILHLRYTAREGGDAFRDTVVSGIETALNDMDLMDLYETTGLMQAFSVRHQFPNAWHDFLNPQMVADEQTLQLAINQDWFPYFTQSKNIRILVNKVDLLLVLTDPTKFSDKAVGLTFKFEMGGYQLEPHVTNDGDVAPCFKTLGEYGNQPHVRLELPDDGESPGSVNVIVPEIATQGDVNLNRGIGDLPNEYIVDRDGHNRIDPDAIENIIVVMHYKLE